MLILSLHASRNRRGFTLVEVAIGMAIFSIIAMAVMAASMRAYKEAEDSNRFLAAHALAMSMLQQVTSAPDDRAASLSNGATYRVYNSDGAGMALSINSGTPLVVTLRSTLDQGQKHVEGTFDVNIFLHIEQVAGYASYEITVRCTYKSATNGGMKEIAVSAIAPNNTAS